MQNGEFARSTGVIAHGNNLLRGANVVGGRQVNRALVGVEALGNAGGGGTAGEASTHRRTRASSAQDVV